jgi:hypothetical protein
LLRDTVLRFVRREAERAKRAAKKGPGAFQEWAEEFYGQFGEARGLRAHLAPGIDVELARNGRTDDAWAIADEIVAEYIEESRGKLLGLKTADLSAQVEKLMEEWERVRPDQVAEKITALGGVK